MSEKETAERVLQVLLAFQIVKIFNNIFPEFVKFAPSRNAPIIGHPLGGGDPGQGWGLCKGPCQSSYFPPPRWGHRGIKVPLPEGNHLEQLETFSPVSLTRNSLEKGKTKD